MGTRDLSTFLIVGLGSIGKIHLKKILSYSRDVLIVDPNPKIDEFLTENYGLFGLQRYSSIERIDLKTKIDVAVIANWGPDHFDTLQKLINLGVRRFLIEKPLVSKINDLTKLWDMVQSEEIFVLVNMPWLFSDFEERVAKLQIDFALGELGNVSVSGGAKCLATNGIHYIGLACMLFGQSPSAVASLIVEDFINPRSGHLKFLAGSAFFEFDSGRYLQICFTNNSHLQAQAVMNFQYGRIIFDSDLATVYLISPENRVRIDKPTRTFYPEVEVFKFKPFITDLGGDGTDMAYQSLVEGNKISKSNIALVSTEALLAMMVANVTGERISIPLSTELLTKFGSREWWIS